MKKILLTIVLLLAIAVNVRAATDQILSTEEMVGAGHATKTDTLNRALNKLTTAGDMPYATAAATVARLGMGANGSYKLYTNANSTAPEWALGFKIGTLSRDLTTAAGTVAYTGVGFKPSHIIFLSTLSGSKTMSIGFDDATTRYCIYDNGYAAADCWVSLSGYSGYIVSASSTYQQFKILSMDSDGFTLTWSKANSPSGTATVYYMAFR